jgi:processive 1,2-diacylglycerol beta-glucosyltransferase
VLPASPPPRPRILILTISHGASHRRTAQALRYALLQIRPELVVEIIDALTHCARWFRTYYDSYEIPLKYFPALWGLIEGLQHGSESTGPGWLYRTGARPLFRFIQAFDPDIVIATEVGTCELAAMLKRERRGRFHLVGCTAGVDLDNAWAQPEVDLYPVFPIELAGQLESLGVPSRKILPCGVPVNPGFSFVSDRATVRNRLNADADLPLALILFGGTGFGNVTRIVGELGTIKEPLQTVFISGRNRRLEMDLRKMCRHLPRSRVFGWVENIHEWMAASDLLVSKPGGGTVVEAINSGLPLVAFDPLPGAERRACDLIERWRVGRWARRPSDLALTITRLLSSQEDLQRMRQHALALARPHAALDAAQAILQLCPDLCRNSGNTE